MFCYLDQSESSEDETGSILVTSKVGEPEVQTMLQSFPKDVLERVRPNLMFEKIVCQTVNCIVSKIGCFQLF